MHSVWCCIVDIESCLSKHRSSVYSTSVPTYTDTSCVTHTVFHVAHVDWVVPADLEPKSLSASGHRHLQTQQKMPSDSISYTIDVVNATLNHFVCIYVCRCSHTNVSHRKFFLLDFNFKEPTYLYVYIHTSSQNLHLFTPSNCLLS